VFGVASGSILRLPKPRADLNLNKRLRYLAGTVTPHVSIYSRSWSGRAAAYNAGAEFEAASTLKLPIMIVALSDNRGELVRSEYWDAMVRVTRYSDNAAANELLEQIGGGDADGAADMVAAAAGRGPLPRHGVSPHEARGLLHLMVHAQDPGLVPAGARGLPVAHKIGWLDSPTTMWPSGRRRQPCGRRVHPPGAACGRDLQQRHRGLIS